jgi:hypothetical protein
MNTLKILREMNKELRNKAKDGDSEELQKIGEKFGEQI